MKYEHDTELEQIISRELKALPQRKAPEGVSQAVMTVIRRRLRSPWYARSWDTWPVLQKAVALVLLVAMFAALTAGGWAVTHGNASGPAQAVVDWLRGVGAVMSAVAAVCRAFVLAINERGPWILAGCFAAISLGYAMCIAMGSLALRLALAQSRTKAL